jgi:MvaI/BcnI restriction endonuclease family
MSDVTSLRQLVDLMRKHGAMRIYAKRLAQNDNSKNQVYLGGDFSSLNIIPHGDIFTDDASAAGSKRDRAKAKLELFWVDAHGKYLAPDASLILYPKYPEVRMSGFLKGCQNSPSSIMASRDIGRVLFIGTTLSGAILAHAVEAQNAIVNELNSQDFQQLGVFLDIPADLDRKADTRSLLLAELRRIYEMHWVMSQKLLKGGVKAPYSASNGGGYTLEAELGITPNGDADPDYLGWEVKQYGVNDFNRFSPKSPVTLMTPDPTGGFYKDNRLAGFVKRYGYPDKSGVPDRINFGGIYACGKNYHVNTGLRMSLVGYDDISEKITDINGSVQLVDRHSEVAAEWKFTAMMQHWNRKHAQAAYVPSMFRTPPPEYSFGPQILLCEQTDFILFLKGFARGVVYYDPGIKLENASTPQAKGKGRSQFRIKHSSITNMYHRHEIVDLKAIPHS